jgi:hypothetical protein
MAELHAEYVKAFKDNNGNPRRGWIIRLGAKAADFVDEGYHGTLSNASKGMYPDTLAIFGESTNITVPDYYDWKAFGEDVQALRDGLRG